MESLNRHANCSLPIAKCYLLIANCPFQSLLYVNGFTRQSTSSVCRATVKHDGEQRLVERDEKRPINFVLIAGRDNLCLFLIANC